MSKATHYGTCQCCGSYQKLPSGVLSKHGYTVEWNMFHGVCSGAGHLPFEKDYSLVEKMIERSKSAIVSLKEEMKEVKASTDATKVWKLRGKRWEQRELLMEEIPYKDGSGSRLSFTWAFTPEELEGKRLHEIRYLTEACNHVYPKSLEEAVKIENERYVYFLSTQIEQYLSYIKWQEERIENWEERELEAVKEEYTGPKYHMVRAFGLKIEEGKVKYKLGHKSSCNRSNWYSKVNEFRKVYEEHPERCCKGCVKNFLEYEERVKQLKEKANG